MPSTLQNIISAFSCCKSIDVVPQNNVLQHKGLLHNILQFAGPLDASTISLTSKGMRKALNKMTSEMLEEISTNDIKLKKNDKKKVHVLVTEAIKADKFNKAIITTSVDLLRFLGKDDGLKVLQAVAANPNTPGNTLSHLAKVLVSDIRANVLENPNTPDATRRDLSMDEFLHFWMKT